MIAPVTAPQQAHTQSLWQRPRIYIAKFGNFELTISTDNKDATKERTFNVGQWLPILNVGPHRIGFVGEPLTFDAQDSYKMNFIGGKKRKRNLSQGYGKGSSIGLLTWVIGGWQRLGRPWQEAQTWTPTSEGLYTLTVTSADGGKAQRWIRVYQNRESADINVTQIQGLSGTWGEGWSCELTFQDETIELTNLDVLDGQCFGVYCEDQWWTGSSWVTDVVGHNRHEPRVVMIGYVKEGSVQKNSQLKQVTFTLETITGQMDRSQGHKIAIWYEKGPDADGDGNPANDAAGVQSKNKRKKRKERRRRRRQARRARKRGQAINRKQMRKQKRKKKRKQKRNTDTWGAILKGFEDVCISDFAYWLLQFKTNVLPWHDFYCVWHDDQADLESIAGEESSLLSNLNTVAANDWFVTGAMSDNSLYFLPDRQVFQDDDLTALWPTRMSLGDHDLLDFQAIKKTEQPIKYVKLIATKTADFQSDAKRRRQQRREEKRNQIEESFPGKDPPKDKPGGWFVRSDLLHDNKRVIKKRCETVYNYMNQRWSGQLSMGLNRAIHPGQSFQLAPSNLTALMGQSSVGCLARNVSYEIDLQAQTWKTSIEFEHQVSQAPWVPTMLGTGLLGWYDASTGVSLDGNGKVQQWSDISGNAQHLVQTTEANRPQVSGGAIYFPDGPSNWLTNSIPNWSTTDGRMVLAVCNVNPSTSNGVLYGTSSSGGFQALLPTSTGYPQVKVRLGDPIVTNSTKVALGTKAVYAFDAQPGGGNAANPYWALVAMNGYWTELYHDKVMTNGLTLRIGGGDYDFAGYIHELIICKHLGWWQRTLLEGYLAWKYGLQGNLNYTHAFKNYAPLQISQIGG